jgi:hypothetical protein
VEQEEASEITAVRIQEVSVEPLDLALFLELAVVADGLLENLQRELFPSPHDLAPTNK